MQKELRITPTAKADLERIAEYLIEDWNTKVASDFNISFAKGVSNTVKSKSIRRTILTFQNTIYFKEYSDYIDILVVFDNRQSLKKLRKALK